MWLDAADTEANVAWTRATFDLLSPYFSQRRWLNYFSDDDGRDAVLRRNAAHFYSLEA